MALRHLYRAIDLECDIREVRGVDRVRDKGHSRGHINCAVLSEVGRYNCFIKGICIDLVGPKVIGTVDSTEIQDTVHSIDVVCL